MKMIKKLQRKLRVNLNLDSLLKRGSPEQVYGFLNELYIDPELPVEVRNVAKEMMDRLKSDKSVDGIITEKVEQLKESAKNSGSDVQTLH